MWTPLIAFPRRRRTQAEVAPGCRGGQSAACCSHQETLSDEERLGHFFDRFAFLADRYGQRRQANRPTAETAAHRAQDLAVEPIETQIIDFVELECHPSDVAVHLSLCSYLSEIADPPQQPVGDPRRAPRSPGDFSGAGVIDLSTEQGGGAVHDVLERRRVVEVELSGEAEAVAQGTWQQSSP